MKKAIFFSIISLAFITSASAQFVGLQPIAAFEDSPGNPLQEYVKTYRHTQIPREFTGHYYIDKEFLPGTLVVNDGEKKLNVLLRYNSLKDQVEIKLAKEKDSVYVLPSLENIVYNRPDYSFKFHNLQTTKGKDVDGYFMHYYDGDNVQFLSKPMAHLRDEKEPRSGFDKYQPAHFSVKQFYYLLDESGRLKEVDLREKDFRKEFSVNKEMKQYFSSHKIKTVEDVVEMLKYYEQHDRQS